MKKFFVVIISIIVLIPLHAQFSRVGTSAAQFLKFPADPRTASLGGATTGTYGEVFSLHWNPAGIASIKNATAAFSYANLYADISYNFVGAVIAVGDKSAVGISAFYLDSGEMEQTTVEKPDGTGARFSVKNYCFGLSYARYMTDWLMAGGSVKYIREDLWHESAQTVAFDLGTVLETGFLGTRLGISIANFGSDMQLSGDDIKFDYQTDKFSIERGAMLSTVSWPLPLTFRTGISVDILGGSNELFENSVNKVTILADYNEPNDTNPRGNFGLEYGWDQTLFARAGYFYNYDAARFSYGAGVHFEVSSMRVKTDFAMVDYRNLGYIYQYALSLDF
jgi:hypothetical protein